MTRASCGLVWNPTSSGTRAARHLAGSSVQLRAGTAPGQRTPAPLALASAKKAPTWQLSTLPAVPNTGAAPRPRWCPSPGSRSHRPPAPARVAQVLDHTGAQVVADQVQIPVGGGQQPLHPIGVRSPACSASCQPFLRPTLPSSPRRYASTRRRGSARANRPRRGRAGRPPRRPRLHFFGDYRLVGLRHDPSRPPWPLDCQPIPAGGREPYLIPKCGWSTKGSPRSNLDMSSEVS
jgi:hypothetical protein